MKHEMQFHKKEGSELLFRPFVSGIYTGGTDKVWKLCNHLDIPPLSAGTLTLDVHGIVSGSISV